MTLTLKALHKIRRSMPWMLAGLLLLSQTLAVTHIHYDHASRQQVKSFSPALFAAAAMLSSHKTGAKAPVPGDNHGPDEDRLCELCLYSTMAWTAPSSCFLADSIQADHIVSTGLSGPVPQAVIRNARPRAPPALTPVV